MTPAAGGDNRSRSRQIGSTALGVLAAVALLLALVTGYAAQVLFDSDQFANHATAALDKPELSRGHDGLYRPVRNPPAADSSGRSSHPVPLNPVRFDAIR